MENEKFYLIKCKVSADEVITIRHLMDGRALCPVCGCKSIHPCEPAWSETLEYGDDGLHYCGASFNICSCCDTQYGLDDVDRNVEGKKLSTNEAWAFLRKEWLLSMRRLKKLEEAIGQLRSIDISDAEINAILKQEE